MQKKPQYKIIGTYHSNLVVSSQSYEKFVIHQFPYSVKQPSIHLKLIQSKSQSLVPVVQYTITNERLQQNTQDNNTKLRIITGYYQSTFLDIRNKKEKFNQEQLTNTLNSILQLLQNLYTNNIPYGMLSQTTVCFYKDQIKLGYGNFLKREAGQSYIEADLKQLGLMILSTAIPQQGQIQDMLKLAKTKYSDKFIQTIKTLINPISKYRKSIFNQNSKDHSLIESNSENSYEFISQKISSISQIVNECLKRSRKAIEKSENKRIK